MKKPTVEIEQLTTFSIDDFEHIQHLISQLGSTFQPLTDEDFKSMIQSPVIHLFVTRNPENNKIIGMATLALYRIPYLKKAYLDDFIVEREYQGKGIGSALIKSVLNFANKSGAGYIEFTSNPKRIGANKFYKKFGFESRDTNVYRLTF